MTRKGLVMKMCTMAMKHLRSKSAHKRDTDVYKRYAADKAKIPVGLSAQEYEAEVQRLLKKYKI